MNPFLLNIIGISVFDLLGVLCAKYYSIYKNPILAFIAFASFFITGVFFVRSIQYEGVAIINLLWTSISVILVTIFGYFLFKEHITLMQFVGIALTVIGIVLIELK